MQSQQDEKKRWGPKKTKATQRERERERERESASKAYTTALLIISTMQFTSASKAYTTATLSSTIRIR